MENALTSVHKLIENERKVNSYLLKGSIMEKPMANIKRYHALRIYYVRQEKKEQDKVFTKEEFKKYYLSSDSQKRSLSNLAPVGDANSPKREGFESAAELEERQGSQGDIDKSGPSPTKVKDSLFDGPGNLDDGGTSFIARMEAGMDKKSKLNLKFVIQNIFKNIKNIFTNDELNVPNETLFRAVVIKKAMIYLVLLLMSAAIGYLVYVTNIQQYSNYNFKLDSMFAITKYQNATISLINEYMIRSLYCSNNAADPRAFCKDVESRIFSFRNIMGNQDIDNNVRNDFFFSSVGQTNVSFVLDYPDLSPRNASASKYTITLMMLEKLLAYDISAANQGDARVFIDNNFLAIINQYFIDCKQAALDSANSILASNQV